MSSWTSAARGAESVEDEIGAEVEELAARTNRTDDEIRMFMRDNGLRLLGLDQS